MADADTPDDPEIDRLVRDFAASGETLTRAQAAQLLDTAQQVAAAVDQAITVQEYLDAVLYLFQLPVSDVTRRAILE